MSADFQRRHGSDAARRAANARARWLAGAASILVAVGSSAASEPVAYTAKYKLRAYGLRGALSMEQRPEPAAAPGESQVWRYRTEIRAKGLGKLFLGGTTFEDVVYEVRDGGRLRPLHATGEDTMKDRARDVTFTWAEDGPDAGPVAEGTDNGNSFSMEMPPEVLDRALLVPAIALDLGANGAERDENGHLNLASAPLVEGQGYRFRVLERGRLRDYYARLLGEETLKGPDGEPVETLVFEHQREGSSRITTLWLAPDLDYLPLRIQQRKNDKKPHMRALLKDYQPLDPDQQQQQQLSRDVR